MLAPWRSPGLGPAQARAPASEFLVPQVAAPQRSGVQAMQLQARLAAVLRERSRGARAVARQHAAQPVEMALVERAAAARPVQLAAQAREPCRHLGLP